MTNTFKKLFQRDLNKLKKEIEAYKDEQNLWLSAKEVSNSAGNLVLHLVGNLRTFIGADMGNSGYIRQRDLEFSQKNIPRTDLLRMVDETLEDINKALDQITETQLNAPCKYQFLGPDVNNKYFLTHLITHLNYHLGQINYHRRFLDK